jgi:hypothetical protein
VVVIDLIWEMMILSVINQFVGAVVKFNTIVKIRKYKELHERHHFISMTMEMHMGVIWIVSLGSVLLFFTIDN